MKRVAYLVDPVEGEYRTTTLAWVENHPYSPSRSQQAGFEIKKGGVFLFLLVVVFFLFVGCSCFSCGCFCSRSSLCSTRTQAAHVKRADDFTHRSKDARGTQR